MHASAASPAAIRALQGRRPTLPPTRLPSFGERRFLSTLRRKAERQYPQAHARQTALRLGIGDDCAILRPAPGDDIVITTDLFLEQVHFRRDWHQPEVAGHRCLARGLSDIAAMGARPVAAFLSFALPPELSGDWTNRFLDGLLRLATRHHVPLAGGDTAQAPSPSPAGALFSADIVLLGNIPRGKALLRSGARPGDLIYVTGALGGAAAELASLQLDPAAYAHLRRSRTDRQDHPHLFPVPRLDAGNHLPGRATAAIDLSDGLSTDLAHLCEESGVAAEIEASLLPIHRLAQAMPADMSRKTGHPAYSDGSLPRGPLSLALHGGEDYELLFTAPPGRKLPASLGGTPIHHIGTILKAARGRPRVTLITPDGTRKPLRNQGWEHFRSRS